LDAPFEQKCLLEFEGWPDYLDLSSVEFPEPARRHFGQLVFYSERREQCVQGLMQPSNGPLVVAYYPLRFGAPGFADRVVQYLPDEEVFFLDLTCTQNYCPPPQGPFYGDPREIMASRSQCQ